MVNQRLNGLNQLIVISLTDTWFAIAGNDIAVAMFKKVAKEWKVTGNFILNNKTMKCIMFDKPCELLTCSTERKCRWEEDKVQALKWWNSFSFEEKWYKLIEHKTVIEGDYINKGVARLTDRDIIHIHKAEEHLS